MPSYKSEFLQEVHANDCPIAVYRGSGEVVITDGEPIECNFEITQTKDGSIYLRLNSFPIGKFDLGQLPKRFHGVTDDGFCVDADKFNIQDEVSFSFTGAIVLFRLNEVIVTQIEQATWPVKLKFGITNFEFLGPEAELIPTGVGHRVLTLSLNGACQQRWFKVSRTPGYEEAIRRLKLFKGTEITSEVETQANTESDIDEARRLVGDLCYLLSVTRGSKVQWVYFDKYGPHGNCIARIHSARITKSYGALPTLNTNDPTRIDLRAFLEHAHRAFLEKRELLKLDRGAIELYLDAKTEHDFLDTRATKLAISLEFLKTVFLRIPKLGASRFVVPKEIFGPLEKSIKSSIKPILNNAGLSSEKRKLIYANLMALNNVPFEELINQLCHYLNLEMPERAIKLFVACRNKLVHEGAFYCKSATEEERARCQPLPNPWSEYAFLVSFLDRILLRILDYDGPFIDWSSGQHIYRDAVCTAPPTFE